MADDASGIVAPEAQKIEQQYSYTYPLDLSPDDFDEEIDANHLFALSHGYGYDEAEYTARCTYEIGIVTVVLEVGKNVVAKDEKEAREETTAQVERDELATGMGTQKHLAEAPEPQHVEDDMEGVLREVGMAEHIGDERPWTKAQIREVGRQREEMLPAASVPEKEDTEELPELRDDIDDDRDVDELLLGR